MSPISFTKQIEERKKNQSKKKKKKIEINFLCNVKSGLSFNFLSVLICRWKSKCFVTLKQQTVN